MLARITPRFDALPANDVETPARVDPIVERALELMHADPGADWTVSSLAKATGCSRAVFARRFAAATGTTPRAFLTLVRMHVAAKHLVHGEAGLAAIAAMVGYATEFAFGRAFKRVFRMAPGRFRRAMWKRSVTSAIQAAA